MTAPVHYPLARPRLLRWLTPRCAECGQLWSRCVGTELGQRHPDEDPPAAPLLGILLAVLVVIGAGATGVAWLLEWI